MPNTNLTRRLNEIEESVNLGTLDTTILGLLFFVSALDFTFLSIGIPKLIAGNQYLLTGYVFFLLITAIPIAAYVWSYSSTIFFKPNRFTNKKRIITLLIGQMYFIVEMWLFLAAASIWNILQNYVVSITITLLLFAIVFSTCYIYRKVSEYIEENFKALLARRQKEIEKEKKHAQ